jgi:beta-galactosidase
MLTFLKRLLYVWLMLQSAIASAQRIKATINTNWQFYKGDIAGYPAAPATAIKWQSVSIPHSWNTADVTDDEKGYYRGVGWYTKRLSIPVSWKNKDVSLFFEGASQVADVYINGKKAGSHIGGYTYFNIPIQSFLNFDEGATNIVAVKVDNSHNDAIPPLSADFTFFGGIYRDVYLVVANPVHFDTENHASTGVFITTPNVSADKADVILKGALVNRQAKAARLQLITRITSAKGELIAQQKSSVNAAAGQRVSFAHSLTNIRKPHLWSPDDPYLYHVTTVLTDSRSQQQLDEVSNPLGFRWYKFDAQEGFFLNGKHYKLMGASRHQDFEYKGNALPDALHVRDVELLKNMGANYLRVAHYPQDPEVLQACDRLGVLASVEIPVVNQITESAAFAQNCKNMQIEMIRQNFNHPSVIIWAYMNEVLLRMPYTANSSQRQAYLANVTKLAQGLEDTTRREDPYRYTMIPNHGAFELYNAAKLTQIPKIVGWNLYQGWYGGELSAFAQYLDRHHKDLPDKPVIITEYGADADPRVHSMQPVRFDKSNEYAVEYHKAYIKAMDERPFVAGGAIWNLADFNSEQRAESMPHINNKGITTLNRQPKDSYWLYKAHLLSQPFMVIGSKGWTMRAGVAPSKGQQQFMQPVEVYTNLPKVALKLNGRELGTQMVTDNVARFDVPFVNGENKLQAVAVTNGKTLTDDVTINFKLIPANLKSEANLFTEINVSLGDKRYLVDNEQQLVWVPEKPYEPGSWGYIGGEAFTMKGNGRISYGSDKDILGTDNDPMYETQRVGIEQFKLDVPNGNYEVTLHFAELLSEQKAEELVYNLSANNTPVKKEDAGTRAFDVAMNSVIVLENLSNTNYLEPDKAYSTKVMVNVTKGEGLIIDFKPRLGKTILNGLQVRKLY